ncbi:MAG: GNAT family N-acetyltransferase [Desulfomonilaceae bacterium]
MQSRPYNLKIGYSAAEDEQAILALAQLVWGSEEPGSPPYFRWQYLQNPLGRALIGSMASSSGALAAHIACMPVLVEMTGQWLPCGLVVNAVTHPQHRRQGLFERLGSELIDEAHRIGLPLLVTVPNDSSIGVFKKKLGFQEIAKHCLMAKWVDPGVFLAQHGFKTIGRVASVVARPFFFTRRTSRRVATSCQVQPIDDIRSVAVEKLVHRSSLATNREVEQWFHWRYGAHPTRRYQYVIAGSAQNPSALMVYHVLTPYRKAFLSDFLFTAGASVEAAKEMAGFVVDSVRQQGASAIWCMVKQGSRRAQLLKRCGFWPVLPGSRFAPRLLARPMSAGLPESALSEVELSFGSLVNCD